MRLAQVVAVHPERRTVDIVFMDSSLRVAEVHVLSSLVSSDSGEWSFPSVPKPSSERQAGSLPTSGRQIAAAVDTIEGRPVIVGFLHPLGGQMAFNEQDRQVVRHSSGAYSTISPAGDIEVWHPSGAYVRIGQGGHQSLTAISPNNVWKEVSNAPAPSITVHSAKFEMVIDPEGNITMHGQGNATLTVDKTMTWNSGQDMHFNAGTTLSFTSQQGTTVQAATGSLSFSAPQINLN